MKKQFLTIALLATVAVGAAFAGNANLSTVSITHGSPYNDNGNCETPTIVRPGQNCDVQPSLYRCTLLIGGDLNLLKKMKTIDPIDTAKFKIAKIESSKSLTFSSPALMVNANSCSSGRLMFIESKIQAMNDLETIFKDAMVIDVYDLIGQQYLYSFYLRSHDQQKATQFKVIGNYIFVLSDQYLIRYTIELPEN